MPPRPASTSPAIHADTPVQAPTTVRLLIDARDRELAERVRVALSKSTWPAFELLVGDLGADLDGDCVCSALDGALLGLARGTASELAWVRAVRAHRPELPIIVLMPRADEALALAARRAGADEALAPHHLDPDVLPRLLHPIVDRERVRRELAELEQQLVEARRLERLALSVRSVGHALNNQLIAILGNAELALLDLRQRSPLRDVVREIETAGQTASTLVRELAQQVADPAAGLQQLDLARETSDAIGLIELAQRPEVRIDLELCTGAARVAGDAGLIRELILHLLGDAIDHASARGGGARIRVTIGIRDGAAGEEALLALSPGPARVDAACRWIAHEHRGRIERMEDGQDGLRLVLPRHGQAAQLPATAGRPAAETSEGAPPVVLVIGADPIVCRVAYRMLERMGYDVLTAASGRRAIELLDARRDGLHAVVIDLAAPGVDREHTLVELRRRQPDLPVVLCGAAGEPGLRRAPAARRHVAYAAKPFRLGELNAKLAEAARR